MYSKKETRVSATKNFVLKHITAITIFSLIGMLALAIHLYDGWGAFGFFVLQAGLGIKAAGAKKFSAFLMKAGTKKMIFFSTLGVLGKRHLIDVTTKFFHEHSFSRYKKNVVLVVKHYFKKLNNTKGMKKIQTLVAAFLSIPIVYVIWTKVIGTALQKFLYKIFITIGLVVWTFIYESLSFISNFFVFLFQVVVVNLFINTLDRSTIGKKILAGFSFVITFFKNMFDNINKGFVVFGFDPKHYLIVKSNKFNRYLEDLLDNNLNAVEKLAMRRERHFTSRELLLMKREAAQLPKPKKRNFIRNTKKLFRKIVLKEKTWKEKRANKKVNPKLAKRKPYQRKGK